MKIGSMKFKIIFASIVLLLSVFMLNAQEKKPKNWSLNGYVKDMQTIIFSDPSSNWTTDNLIHNRLNFKWYPNNFLSVQVGMRNRFVWGELLSMESLMPDSLLMFKYSDYIDEEKGFFDVSDKLLKGNSYILHSTFDRFFIDITKDKFLLRIGRQRINWSQTFAWNPNDLFNTYSFFDFDYEEKPGSDAVKLTYYPSISSQIDVAAKLDFKNRLTAAAMYRFNTKGFDIQFLGGILNDDDLVIGSGWSGSLFKGGFRGEMSYFHPKDDIVDSSGQLVLSVGYDYTFQNSLMLQGEILYNSKGKSNGDFNVKDFYFLDLSAKNLSITEWTLMLMGAYPITPLLNASISAMYSPNMNFFFAGPTITYSLKENLDFSLTAQTFLSDVDADLGGKGTYVFLRFKQSF